MVVRGDAIYRLLAGPAGQQYSDLSLKTSSPSIHWINYALTESGAYFRFRDDNNHFYRIKAENE